MRPKNKNGISEDAKAARRALGLPTTGGIQWPKAGGSDPAIAQGTPREPRAAAPVDSRRWSRQLLQHELREISPELSAEDVVVLHHRPVRGGKIIRSLAVYCRYCGGRLVVGNAGYHLQCKRRHVQLEQQGLAELYKLGAVELRNGQAVCTTCGGSARGMDHFKNGNGKLECPVIEEQISIRSAWRRVLRAGRERLERKQALVVP